MIAVDRADITRFVGVLFRYCDDGSYVSLRTFCDAAEGVWRRDLWAAPQIANGCSAVIEAAVALAEAAAQAPVPVVFCPPVATFKSAKGAAEKDILNGLALSVECDQNPEQAREILENTLGPATVTVASGGLWTDPETGEVQNKIHLHWRLTKPTRGLAEHIKLKEARRFATMLVGADASAVPLVHPLRWPGSVHRKAEPRLARIGDLRDDVEIELDDALEALKDAVEALPKGDPKAGNGRDPGGYTPEADRQPSRFGAEAEALDIIAALAVIPNDELNWKRWSDIGMAVWHASSSGSEAGYAAFLAWSSKCDGFNSTTTRQRWNDFTKNPPGAIGAGTLFHLAREAWPGWEKPSDLRRRAANDPGEPPPHIADPNRDDTLPTITVRAGLRHDAADAGLAAVAAAGTAFYQRGERIVRAEPIAAKTADGSEIFTPGIVPVGHAALGRALGMAARWERFDRKGELFRIDPPEAVVEQIADMAGEWPFPLLAGVIGTPTMRADGSLLLEEGYDEKTGLVLLGAPAMPAIPARPTKADAERALLALESLLVDFPFKDGGGIESVDRAVALSELLTPVLRGAMPTAPMHLSNAPQPGTGKSYLADLASCIATGERAAVVAFSTKPEETEKRLTGSALGGHPILALDNASGTIEGDLLCQITERPLLQLRPLGTSRMARVANTFSVLANGNNAEVSADMVRRTIECRLDANMEDPSVRSFSGDPLAAIRRARGTYIAAALVIARAYLCAGKPGQLTPLASYEAWSNIVRSPLVWLGRADPVASMASLRSIDPARITRTALFRAWAGELEPGAYQTADLINRANDRGPGSGELLRPGLRAALLDFGRDRHGGLEARRIGKWLSKNENNVADGLKLTCDRTDAARPRWILQQMSH